MRCNLPTSARREFLYMAIQIFSEWRDAHVPAEPDTPAVYVLAQYFRSSTPQVRAAGLPVRRPARCDRWQAGALLRDDIDTLVKPRSRPSRASAQTERPASTAGGFHAEAGGRNAADCIPDL